MESLNDLYIRLLQVGMIVLRQAVWSDNRAWAQVEVQHLHNIPSLINEPNIERHRYFWFQERQIYMEWIDRAGPEQKSRMAIYYMPVWKEMEPLMQKLLDQPVSAPIGKWQPSDTPTPSASN